MVLTPEQVKELKRQLSEQIKNLPEEQKKQAQAQIDSMSAEALETMLRQQQAQQGSQGGQKGIFRMLVDEDIPAKRVDENKEVIAVVSKRAASKGHVLIIPKKPVGDAKNLPSSAFTLAKKIAKRIEAKLKANSSEIQTERAFGEVIVNVMPVYDKPVGVGSERYEASDEEMEEVYQKLIVVKKQKIEKVKIKKEPKKKAVLKLKRRIP
jgi:histidine triad (HIT) family protein